MIPMRPVPWPVVMFEYRDRDGRYVNVYAAPGGGHGPYSLGESSEAHRPDWFSYYFTEPLIRLIRAGGID